jgi:hypothetical protein
MQLINVVSPSNPASDFTSKVSMNPHDNSTPTLLMSAIGMFGSSLGAALADGGLRLISALIGAAVGVSTIYFMRRKDKRDALKMEIFLAEHQAGLKLVEEKRKKEESEEE